MTRYNPVVRKLASVTIPRSVGGQPVHPPHIDSFSAREGRVPQSADVGAVARPIEKLPFPGSMNTFARDCLVTGIQGHQACIAAVPQPRSRGGNDLPLTALRGLSSAFVARKLVTERKQLRTSGPDLLLTGRRGVPLAGGIDGRQRCRHAAA
jgi:hypothetical protein